MPVTQEEYVGVVTSVDDPEKRGRIRVVCAQLMGSEEEELPMWVNPSYEWGWFIVPDPGEQVSVIASTSSEDDEQLGQTSIASLDLKWKGREWGNEETEEEQLKRPIPEDFTASNYGKRRGFATPQGHVFLFDDTESEPKISITWASGDPKKPSDQKRAFLSFDNQGIVLATAPNDEDVQSVFFMNGKNGEILLVDSTGNSIGTTSSGIVLTQAADGESKASIELKSDGTVTILSAAGVVLNTKNVHLNAGEVKLGSGPAAGIVQPAILGTIFQTIFETHTHTSTAPGSPTSPPTGAPGLMLPALSLEVKVK